MTPRRRIRAATAAAVCLLTVAGAPLAASPEDAAKAYADGDWPAASTAYRELAEANPTDGRSAYRLAVALRHTGEYDEAERWLARAEAAGTPSPYVEVERARVRMAAGDPDGAVAAIEAAAAAGYPDAAGLESAPEFDALSADARFVAAVDQIRRNAAPCEHDPRFSQFDFWVGEWRVLDAGGALQGENRIEKIESGCLLLERWSGATGGTGTSMNFFDAAAGQWVQVWVSPTLQLEIRGGLEDGAMRLDGTIYYLQTGQRLPFRGTWTPRSDGVVRQHFEQSTDGGATWATWFDGYYHPARGEPAG
jgi:hypothetical protein